MDRFRKSGTKRFVEHRDPGGTEVLYTGTGGGGEFGVGLESSHYDALGRMTGSPLETPPTQNESNSPRFPSPVYEASLDLYHAANGCQMMVDGILQNCDSISVWSLNQSGSHGGPARSSELPGMRFSYTLPGHEFGYDYLTGEYDENGLPILGTQTVHFNGPSVTIGGWGKKPWAIVGFDPEKKKIIEDQVNWMYDTDACSKAFEAAGLQSVKSMRDSGQMIFVHERTVVDESKRGLWSPDTNLSSQMRDMFLASVYYNGVTPPGGYNGNYYVGLRDRAFGGDDGAPIDIIIHELIHAGGAKRDESPIPNRVYFPPDRAGTAWSRGGWGIVGERKPKHDLEGLNFKDGKYTGAYDNIIRACQFQK